MSDFDKANTVPAAADALQVPFSAGTSRPKFRAPEKTCDCHHHIFDPVRFPYAPEEAHNQQPPATVDDYRLLKTRLGIARNVIVQPTAYGLDNRCTLDALKQGGSSSRAIVVVDTGVADKELVRMHDLGVRGIRFNIVAEGALQKSLAMIEPLSGRVAELGWQVHFWAKPDDIVSIADLLLRLPSAIVFDHFGHIPQPAGAEHSAFRVICRLIDGGRTWVKLSGAYQDSKIGAPGYDDAVKLGQAYVRYAPERMVWGSDWPHPGIWAARKPMVNDVELFDTLGAIAPEESLRNRILADNPAILFDFPR